MIGDSYLTDGGAIDAGMLFIHVQPVKGNESLMHSATRLFAYLCAKMYER
jgi:predicted HAD superfamily phosphohydrolase YqeG